MNYLCSLVQSMKCAVHSAVFRQAQASTRPSEHQAPDSRAVSTCWPGPALPSPRPSLLGPGPVSPPSPTGPCPFRPPGTPGPVRHLSPGPIHGPSSVGPSSVGVCDSFCFDPRNIIGRVIHRTAVKVEHHFVLTQSLIFAW